MFKTLSTTHTPTVKYWNNASGASTLKVSLDDDCAPIQYFATGGSSTAIDVYLPSNPPQGKVVKIKNDRLGSLSQKINIIDPSFSTLPANPIFTIGPSQSIDLVYINEHTLTGSYGYGRCLWVSMTSDSTRTAALQYSFVSGNNNIPASNYATVIGTNNTNTGGYSALLGSSSSTLSSAYGVIGGGASHFLNFLDSYGSIVGGNSNSTSNWANSGTWPSNYSTILGGSNNFLGPTLDGTISTIAGGRSNVGGTSTSGNAFVYVFVGGGRNHFSTGARRASNGGGSYNTNNSTYGSIVNGTYCNGITYGSIVAGSYATCRAIGTTVFAGASPISNTLGLSQSSVYVLGRQTTSTTPIALCSDQSAASSANQIVLPNNSAFYVDGCVIANVTGGSSTKSWKFECLVKRGSAAAATTIVGAININVLSQELGSSDWGISITADTTNGGLAISVIGDTQTIRWVAKMETTEVTF